AWPQVGERFGEFQVLEELGIGSIAHVYLCLQANIGHREVVVKATPYSSFEASILGRLDHPNITRIFSTGFVEASKLHYICMPFCGRSTLRDVVDFAFHSGSPRDNKCIREAACCWMRQHEIPVNVRTRRNWFYRRSYVGGALAIAVQIADALETAH